MADLRKHHSQITVPLVLLISLLSHDGRSQDKAAPGQIGYQSAPDAEHKKTVLLKDFTPQPMLHAPAHSIDRAKYYVIDVHMAPAARVMDSFMSTPPRSKNTWRQSG